jgi:hypothetical protein
MRRINSWTSSLDGCISGMLRLMRGMIGNIRGHGADLLLDGVAVVMCLLDVGSPVMSIMWVAVPLKGFCSLTRNSPDGGGAIERGMLMCVGW